MKQSWIHPDISIREVGALGVGYFADKKISKNDIIIVQGGMIATEADLDPGSPSESQAWHAFQIERNIYICPYSSMTDARDGIFLVNHSCNPSCGFRGQITLVAMRDIDRDEQITYDYAMTDWGETELGWSVMKCICGEASCRGEVGLKDWIRQDLQLKYNGYFSRYIQDAINDTRKS